ncbi:MAG: response regulator transcription factor [Ardenticatenaceae bacterium]|nr:response regulator transcription factor [Anaerolineales bacterium]MCB8937499.1 response regulator transcription factor [Ardenticatenaceae bacterium]MCB8975520.1 response regulator transcription factor [Ardenticatenaceae bacterium]
MSEIPPSLSVAIVANDPLARAGLATLLAAEPACDIIAQMSLADWLADLQTDDWDEARLDGVVWDVGWAAVVALPEDPFPLPVVALLPDETAVSHLWSLGIQAMLRRDASAGTILAALQTAVHGVAALDVEFVTAVRPATPTAPEILPELVELTPREQEVLTLLAEGLTNKAIAHQLEISDHTVKFHVNAILGKLNAQSRTEAVVQATRLGLLLL